MEVTSNTEPIANYQVERNITAKYDKINNVTKKNLIFF